MHTVRIDQHGPLLLCGGYCFRPVYPKEYLNLRPDGTAFETGDRVNANHRRGTPLATVKRGEVSETWLSHGAYMSERGNRPSHEIYKPDYFTW